MKFVISAAGKKRHLPVPFAMCGSLADFKEFYEKLGGAIAAAEALPGGFSYGWLDIHARLGPVANTPPSEWTDD